MVRSLSDLIREGFAQALLDPCSGETLRCAHDRELALADLSWRDMTSLMHLRRVPASRQDEVLRAGIRCYRGGARRIWGPVLLAMLGPAVIALARRVRRSSLEVDGFDLDQQAVLEVLRACAEMPLSGGCRFVQRRVLLLANKRLARWAAR